MPTKEEERTREIAEELETIADELEREHRHDDRDTDLVEFVPARTRALYREQDKF